MVAQVVVVKGRLVMQEPKESGRSPVFCLVRALSIANSQPETTSGAKLRPSTAPPMGSRRGGDIQRQFCVAWMQFRVFAHAVVFLMLRPAGKTSSGQSHPGSWGFLLLDIVVFMWWDPSSPRPPPVVATLGRLIVEGKGVEHELPPVPHGRSRRAQVCSALCPEEAPRERMRSQGFSPRRWSSFEDGSHS